MKINSLILIVVAILLMACKKAEKSNATTTPAAVVSTGTVPKVQTALLKNVTTIAAQSGGSITDNGGNTVTSRGLVLSLNPNPTIGDTKFGMVSVTGAGEFVSEISGLKAGTVYYLRAYAVNKNGIGY